MCLSDWLFFHVILCSFLPSEISVTICQYLWTNIILWDSLPSFPPVSLAFFCVHPLILPSFPFRKMITHCIEKLTFHAAEFVSIWEDIQKLDYYFFFYGCCAFTVLLSIFSLCVRYSTCNLIPVDNLLPLLYYSIKYVDIKAFKGFLLLKTSIFCI